MQITIKRYRQKGAAVDGHLYIDNEHVCDTAENTLYMMEAGTYQVRLVNDLRLRRKFPNLGLGCNIRYGNGVYNIRDSTILVGTYIAPGCLSHSREAFDTLYQRIRKSIERGNQVSLIIEN